VAAASAWPSRARDSAIGALVWTATKSFHCSGRSPLLLKNAGNARRAERPLYKKRAILNKWIQPQASQQIAVMVDAVENERGRCR